MEYVELSVSPPRWRQHSTKCLQYSLLVSLIANVSLLWAGYRTLVLHSPHTSPSNAAFLETSPELSRMSAILPMTLTLEQRALYDRILAGAMDSEGKPLKTRVNADGSLTGFFNAMLLNPKLGQDGMNFIEDLRFGNLTIRHRVVETVILRTAFDTKCGYEFCAHIPMAGDAGLSEAAIEALRQGKHPHDLHADQTVALRLAIELNHGIGRGAVSDETYAAAVQELGEQGVFEVVTVTGFYIALSQIINTFQMPCANGQPDPFTEY